ncbi:MAG: hypothetical protein H6657_25575 [Ardenticatenaceae bacterium]|nr:hypothetical protein [Ardenticatenaceae bacterium]
MRTFRVKDLTVGIGGQGTVAQTPQFCTIGTTAINTTPFCCYPYSCLPRSGCDFPTRFPRTCWPITWFDTCTAFSPIVNIGDPLSPIVQPALQDLDNINVMRDQLKQLLQQVEERGVQLEQAMQPQSLAEAEQLEEQLNAALEEIRSMKKNLK